ncbi:peptidoglycan recognition protein [Streptomyces pathocidini]|uniref:peptidoglycan recognition protein family protein n=1 Tax=Streptomyces pathocidini TaxID=1650571 RepID=UPI0033F33636
MRALLASSIGVACAAALTVPLALSSGATAAPTDSAPASQLAGSTQSLPLSPLTGSDRARAAVPEGVRAYGLPEREVKPFSLVGIVWNDPASEFHGQAEVRTRDAETGDWSEWEEVQTHSDDQPDLDSPDRRPAEARGGSAPLWVGRSVGIQVRALPNRKPADGPGDFLPDGLRIDLIDPGDLPDYAGMAQAAAAASAVNGDYADMGAKEISPEDHSDREDDREDEDEDEDEGSTGNNGPNSRPYVGPRPRIVTRAGWGADERLRTGGFIYTKTVKAAFVHHSATGNTYSCSQVPAILRGIYRFHVRSLKWRDFGYNFVVDKCGNIYEGRAGGVARPVMGAHTLGFNSNTMGVAVLGTYSKSNPSAAAVRGVSQLTAWKLGLFGANPRGRTTLVSAGSNKYKRGARVTLNVISGHRDGFVTSCPGAELYRKLPSARWSASQLQGR